MESFSYFLIFRIMGMKNRREKTRLIPFDSGYITYRTCRPIIHNKSPMQHLQRDT